MIYFGLTILSRINYGVESTRTSKIAQTFFFPTVSMAVATETFIKIDSVGLGVTFDTWEMEYYHFSVRDGILFMINGSFWMLLLGIYLDKVIPNTSGTHIHPCACFKRFMNRKK